MSRHRRRLNQHFSSKSRRAFRTNLGFHVQLTEDDVDVFMSGYAFRLKILHERGLSLVNRKSGAQKKWVMSSDKNLFLLSQHSSMINGLRGRFPIYGQVVRLAKRWISAHLFSSALTEETIELLVAYLFLKPLPFRPPCSRITGFLRFLRLLSQYNWSFSPLIVDINGDLTPDDDKEINEHFMLTRKEDSQNVGPAMFVATAYDKASETWTSQRPTAAELRRLVAYTASSSTLLTRIIMQNQIDPYQWQCLFRTPLSNYDAVILLHVDKLPYPHHLLFPSEVEQGWHVISGRASKTFQPFFLSQDMEGSSKELKNNLMVNFEPLKCLVADIEKEFSIVFKVWYDSLGGDAVGLTFVSKKRRRDEFSEDDNLVDSLQSVGKLGKGFIKSVHLLKTPILKRCTSKLIKE